MTSTVTISAHCVKEKEVVFRIVDKNDGDKEIISGVLQDNETVSHVVFDGRELTVSERIKS